MMDEYFERRYRLMVEKREEVVQEWERRMDMEDGEWSEELAG